MADRKRNSILITATVILLFSSFGNGTYQECLTSLRNTVVYEGTLNTLLSCTNGPNGTAWSVKPTSAAPVPYQITNYNDAVAPALSGLYAFNQSGLIVRNATTSPTGGPITTAGAYTVNFPNSSNQIQVKLVVLPFDPICSCDQSVPNSVKISCTIIYADHPVAPIYPILSCTANGQFYVNTTTTRTPNNFNSTTFYVNNSTLNIAVNNSAPATYDCKVTFSAPANFVPNVATNAPDFSFNFTVCEGQTTTSPPTTTTSPPTTTIQPTTMTKPQTTILPSLTTATTEPQTTTIQPTTMTQPQTITYPSPTTTTTEPQTTPTSSSFLTTPTPPATVSLQTAPVQQTTTASNEVVLPVAIILSVVLGCLLLTAFVCCWWCFWFRPYPRYLVQVKRPIPSDYGSWGRRYIPRYTGNYIRRSRFTYEEPPFC